MLTVATGKPCSGEGAQAKHAGKRNGCGEKAAVHLMFTFEK
jgi:hypothetical protein